MVSEILVQQRQQVCGTPRVQEYSSRVHNYSFKWQQFQNDSRKDIYLSAFCADNSQVMHIYA